MVVVVGVVVGLGVGLGVGVDVVLESKVKVAFDPLQPGIPAKVKVACKWSPCGHVIDPGDPVTVLVPTEML